MPLHQFSKILDLGPLHSKVATHLKSLISNINLVIGLKSSYKTAALDEKPFKHPKAFYVVKMMANDEKTYPHLRGLLTAFLQGALETFEHFSSEFDPNSFIATATTEQRNLAHMETTNDANEGILSSLCVSMRRAPCMSLAQVNAHFCYKKNNTGSYMRRFLGQKEQKYLWRCARVKGANGAEEKWHIAQVTYDKQTAQKNKVDAQRKLKKCEAVAEKLNAVRPVVNVADLTKMHIPEIDLQIRWHHIFNLKVPQAKDLPKRKEEKVVVL
ncbi:hypothetical protein HYDPIDRAFT_29059 [Hydnomerulius pinastri MD-312]|uniref:Uncharacterized protein n=1 Tax=Hydnomerulius pinastri MD-312 TaxID=994086 RepID=A0A0C9W8E3_9AGAM|nr:hypothetical protein HYDPIDRAFT_29059 [Hydnomerulius pinastri MD-312]